jgi:hypothetical protein
MIQLVLHPGTERQERIAVVVSERDIDDAVDYGRASAKEPMTRQARNAAYHMVMEGNVVAVDRVCGEPWVLVQRDRIFAANAAAARITEADLR